MEEKFSGPEHKNVAISLTNLALVVRRSRPLCGGRGRSTRARLAIKEKVLGPSIPISPAALTTWRFYTRIKAATPRLSRFTNERWRSEKRFLAQRHPEVAASLNNLAILYADQGRYAEAEPLYKRALAIKEKVLGPEHVDFATTLDSLASLYADQGRFAEAEPLYKRALAIKEKVLGPEHIDFAGRLNNLATLYKDQSRYAEAEPLYKRALAIKEKVLGPGHPSFAGSLDNLAILYADQSRYAEAEPLYKRALAIREKALGPEHPEFAASLNYLAVLYTDQSRYAEAEPLYERALAIREKSLGPDTLVSPAGLDNLAILYADQKPLCGGRAAVQARAGDQREGSWSGPPRRCRQPSTTWESCTPTKAATPKPSRCTSGRWRSEKKFLAQSIQTLPTASTTWRLCTRIKAATRRPSRFSIAGSRLRAGSPAGQGLLRRGHWMRGELRWSTNRPQEAIADLREALDLTEALRKHASGDERDRAAYFAGLSGPLCADGSLADRAWKA